MDNVENTLKKMALVLDKVVKKVEELDKRVSRLEQSISGGQMEQKDTKSAAQGSFGSSFLGSLAGVVAGMGLYNLLFNNSVSAEDFANKLGVDESEIEEKLENIDEKLEDIDKELEELAAGIEPFEDGISDEEFENISLDDYLSQEEGFDDFDDI